MKDEIKRLNFTLSAALHERLRKEAYVQKTVKGQIIRKALEEYLARKK